jgi:hypothetical protein
MNTAYVYDSAQVGELKPKLLVANGPASYAAAGDPVYNPATGTYIDFPMDALTKSGNYEVKFFPTAAGVGSNYIRAGAPSVTQSGWTAIWQYSGKQGVTVVQNVAGSGMTPGTVVPIVFAGGTGGGAAGTVTVLTATTIAITLTSTGSYTVAPTATISGTGGTPATLTVALTPSGGVVAPGTNLSAEIVQFGAFVSEL